MTKDEQASEIGYLRTQLARILQTVEVTTTPTGGGDVAMRMARGLGRIEAIARIALNPER